MRKVVETIYGEIISILLVCLDQVSNAVFVHLTGIEPVTQRL